MVLNICEIPKENTVLSCRNVWMYFMPHERENLASLMGKYMGENSTVILGFLDVYEGKAGELLERNGFKRCPTGSEFVNIMYSKN